MTATERLRALLDERGVKYEIQRKGKLSEAVVWDGPIGTRNSAFVSNENPDRRTGEILYATLFVTPEQATDATLGRGTCRNVAEPDEYSDRPFTCSECGAMGPLGNGTYHLATSGVTEDGALVFGDSWPVWKYCPNCGRKVVEK